MSIALVIPNFGTNDAIKPMPKRDADVITYFYTDNLREHDPRILPTFDQAIQPPYPATFLPLRQRAYYFKQQTHRVDQMRDYRWLAVADAAFKFRETRFIVDIVDQLECRVESDRILLARHPQRATVDDEAAFLVAELLRGNPYFLRRYNIDRVREQMDWFKWTGLRTDVPLYNAGFIVRENSTPINDLCNAWWDLQMRFGQLDQLGLGVLIHAMEIEPLVFKVPNICENNPYFDFVPHA